MNAPSSPKDYALAFAKRGFAVFPAFSAIKSGEGYVCSCRKGAGCASPAKHPFWRQAPNGLKDATKKPSLVRVMFSGAGFHNVAIATGSVSGIVVLDIDKRHGGFEALAALEAKHGALPTTLSFLTGGGGMHYVFRHPGGVIPNSAGAIGEGIDVRGDGGYIVAPPSRHISGGIYKLAEGCSLDMPLAPAPAWLLGLMRKGGSHSPSSANKPSIADLVREGLSEGNRNNSITRLSGHLLGKRVDPRIVLDLMLAFNAARCSPPLSPEEVARVVASIDHLSFAKQINRTNQGAKHA